MLFNSYDFILNFLPIAFVLYYAFNFFWTRKATNILIIAVSLYFYAFPNRLDLILIISSIFLNYSLTWLFSKYQNKKKLFLVVGIFINLSVLFFYKYINFIIEIINSFLGDSKLSNITTHLPLAISFFTFQQISFIVDQYKAEKKSEVKFDQYAAAVLFFPHLIAGPLVEYKKLIPQLINKVRKNRFWANVYLGIFVFIIGLSKKLIIADCLNPLVETVFSPQADIISLSYLVTLVGVVAYTFQLYFDFSSYSDMAVGLGLMFGVVLPANFNSPYKATSIIDFWRRWHISLSNFLRDYLFIPLGGSRVGELMRFRNLFLTMLIGGIWHGAGWNFIIWGAWHGSLLCAVHLFRKFSFSKSRWLFQTKSFNRALTFIMVMIGWVFFRAHDLSSSIAIIRKIMSFELVGWVGQFIELAAQQKYRCFVLLFAILVAFLMPNSNQMHRYFKLMVFRRKLISIQIAVCLVMAILLNICFILMSSPMSFLYYQF
jgi:alginate O-acetyltransferase complex protein AlgI